MLFLTFVIIVFSFLIYKRHEQMSKFKRLRIPGPKPNFIFGNLIDIGREGMNVAFPKWTKKYGSIVGFFIGGRPQMLVTDFELIRHMLIKDFQIFSNKSQGVPGGVHPAPELQNMIVWATNNTWRNLRATISPSFSSYKLNAMEPLMMTSIEKLVNVLNEKSESGQEINVRPLVSELTFSTGVKCIFGLDLSLNQISNDTKYFLQATAPRLDNSILAMSMVLFPSLEFIAYPLRVLWERFRLHMLWSPEGVCYDIAKKIVQTRREAKVESVDFLQLLMNAKGVKSTSDMDLEMSTDDVKLNSLNKQVQGKSLSEEEILSNAMIFLLASYETTMVTLQFTLHNLINHQNIQDKLRNDLRNVVDNGNNSINFSSLSKVPLLLHVIKETLRMFPPVMPFTTRVPNKDYEYKGIVIPKGTTVFIGV